MLCQPLNYLKGSSLIYMLIVILILLLITNAMLDDLEIQLYIAQQYCNKNE